MLERLIAIKNIEDLPPVYRNTPVQLLFEYHNFNKEFAEHENAEILIGMCMDNRKKMNIPNNFAYILRTGGATLRDNRFKASYAVAIGGVKYIVLVAHNNCGMSDLQSKRENFIAGLVERGGWSKEKAVKHFEEYAPIFEIGDEIDFCLKSVKELREEYPKILIAPIFYNLDDNNLYLIKE
jgi:carbonic anhydrase